MYPNCLPSFLSSVVLMKWHQIFMAWGCICNHLFALIKFLIKLIQIHHIFHNFLLLLKFITYYNFRFSGIQRFIFEDYKPFTESRNWCYSGNGKEAFTNNTNISVHYSHPFHRNCQDGKKLLIFFVNKILMIFTMFHYYVILLSYFVFI